MERLELSRFESEFVCEHACMLAPTCMQFLAFYHLLFLGKNIACLDHDDGDAKKWTRAS
jgi:hypothetical protein